MENIEIRKVGLSDIAQLQTIGRQTFYETFSTLNTEENMSRYLEDSFSLSKLEVEVSNPDTELYLAIVENKVIGYLKVNYGSSQTELKDNTSLEIERIYVLKEFQEKHVGRLLVEKAIDIASTLKVSYVWLGVWERNTKAIEFYEKNGFVAFDKHIFRLGDDEQLDIMMKKSLQDEI
jgi:ribosomal protein S18 acetylase RimI-like enzyme